jgi:DNA (cytosine-5)-methyltransferase 1
MSDVDITESSAIRSELRVVSGRIEQHLDTPVGTRVSTIAAPPNAQSDPRGGWWRAYLDGERPLSASPDAAPIRTAELFCGPGGLALGLRQAADELGYPLLPTMAADQDSDALSVHQRNHSDLATYDRSLTSLVDCRIRGTGDAARFRYPPELLDPTWRALAGTVDVLLAAPPCTGHSTLNYNRGKGDGGRRSSGDARNDLYLMVPAVAVALNAPIVIIENVPAAQWDEQEVVASAVRLLLDAGYHVDSACLSADVLGWPQSRSRFLLVARRDTAPLPLASVASALRDDPRSVMWAIDGLEDDIDSGFMTASAELSEENRSRIDWLFDHDEHDLADSERPDCHKDGTTYTATYGRLYHDRPAPTITTGFMSPGRGRFVHPTRRRVLSAQEAARLQGFPDNYDFRPGGREPSKKQLAKWIGDAVPMPLGYVAALAALAPGRPRQA